MPKYFFHDMLVQHGHFKRETLDLIDLKNRVGLRQMATYCFGIIDGNAIPKELNGDVLALSAWIAVRITDIRPRHEMFWDAGILRQPEFILDFSEGGVYKRTWSKTEGGESRVSKLTHTPTLREVMLTDDIIDDS